MTGLGQEITAPARARAAVPPSRRLRVLLVPDSIYWVTGTIARSISDANPWMRATIVSGPLLDDLFASGEAISARFDLVHFICPYASRTWLPRLQPLMPVVTSHHHVTSWDVISHNIDGDAIVAGSGEWVRDLERRGADMTRVFRVPYGVDVKVFVPAPANCRREMRRKLGLAEAGPVIGFFAKKGSNDDDRKGTDVFAEAVTLLHERLPGAGALVVGPGWKDMATNFRERGIRCTWIPFVENLADLAPLYHALDFYWVTARVEGGPVPLLEAMSSGVCCLSTSVGLASEVVHDGVNGFLLPMNKPAAFAERTLELWSTPTRRLAVAAEARATMKSEMRSEITARLMREVYARAIRNFLDRKPGAGVPVITDSDGVVSLLEFTETGDDGGGLTPAERQRATMLERLAWSENLILYQNQRAAALRLAVRAWLGSPLSPQPARVILRRTLPEGLVRRIVTLKRLMSRDSHASGGARR